MQMAQATLERSGAKWKFKPQDKLNWNLYCRLRLEAGSITDFCSQYELSRGRAMEIGQYLHLRRSPYKDNSRELKTCALVLEELLGVPAEELFPFELYRELHEPVILPGKVAQTTAIQRELLIRRDRRLGLETILSFLPEKQRKVLELRWLSTESVPVSINVVGAILGLSGSRVHQIEGVALRTLLRFHRSRLEAIR